MGNNQVKIDYLLPRPCMIVIQTNISVYKTLSNKLTRQYFWLIIQKERLRQVIAQILYLINDQGQDLALTFSLMKHKEKAFNSLCSSKNGKKSVIHVIPSVLPFLQTIPNWIICEKKIVVFEGIYQENTLALRIFLAVQEEIKVIQK